MDDFEPAGSTAIAPTHPQDDFEPVQASQPYPQGQQIINQERGAFTYPNQRISDISISDPLAAYSLYKTPEALMGLAKGGYALAKGGTNLVKTAWNAANVADSLRPVTSDLEAGLSAQASKGRWTKFLANIKDALYAKTKGAFMPTQGINTDAQAVAKEIATDPKSVQATNAQQIAKDLAALGGKQGQADYATIDKLRSAAGDLAYNGSGQDQYYGGQLKKLIDKHVESFSAEPPIPLSQQGDQAAADLREKWVNAAKEQGTGLNPKQTANYARLANDTPQSSSPAYQLQLRQQQLADNVKQAHGFYRDMSTVLNHPVARAIDRAAPEAVQDVIFKGGRMSSVDAARNVMEPSAFNEVQSHFYQDLLDSPDVGKAMLQYERKAPGYLRQALTGPQYSALEGMASRQLLTNTAGAAAKKLAGSGLVGLGIGVGERLSGKR